MPTSQKNLRWNIERTAATEIPDTGEAMLSQPPVIEIKGVDKYYDTHIQILADITLNIFPNEFVAIVERHLSNENFVVDDICKTIGILRVQLYRKVKALLGYNVNDYIMSVRLQKAKYLLAKEDLSIAEIAYQVGFSSQAYFSKLFKSKFGCTPSEFRTH